MALTIHTIVDHYPRRYSERVLLFVCDNQDTRQAARLRLFEKWLKQSPAGLRLENGRIPGKLAGLYTGMLLRNTKPQGALIEEACRERKAYLKEKWHEAASPDIP